MSYVKYFNPDAQFSTPERCDINELLNQVNESVCSIAKARVAPNGIHLRKRAIHLVKIQKN